jgi:hypothetical protein
MAPFGFPSCSLRSFDGSIPSVKTGTLAQLTTGQGVMAGMSYRDVGEPWMQKAIQNNRDRSRWYVYMMLFPRCFNLLELLPPSVLPSFLSFLPHNGELQISVGTAGPSELQISDLNCETAGPQPRGQISALQISLRAAGPQPRAADLSRHCRTSTASSRSQWALPIELWRSQLRSGSAHVGGNVSIAAR